MLTPVSEITENAKTELLICFLCHREPAAAESPVHKTDPSHSRAAFRKVRSNGYRMIME